MSNSRRSARFDTQSTWDVLLMRANPLGVPVRPAHPGERFKDLCGRERSTSPDRRCLGACGRGAA